MRRMPARKQNRASWREEGRRAGDRCNAQGVPCPLPAASTSLIQNPQFRRGFARARKSQPYCQREISGLGVSSTGQLLQEASTRPFEMLCDLRDVRNSRLPEKSVHILGGEAGP